jgi:hypothetical protein
MSFRSPVTAFFDFGQRAGMDHVHRSVHILQVHNLKETSTTTLTHYQPTAIRMTLRVWPFGVQNDRFSLLNRDAVLGGVVEVPLIPSEASHVGPT